MPVPERPPSGAHQVLTFLLAEQTYGIEILYVQEIKGAAPLTGLPNTPPFLTGVMNLRGTIIPVIDLRVRFALPPAPPSRHPVIIVVKVGGRTMGLLVDAVADVLDLGAEELQPPPDLGAQVDVRFIRGVACVGHTVITVLELASLLAAPAARPPDTAVSIPAPA